MPKPYKHLTNHDRDLLSVLRSKGKSLREIARVLNRDPSTISRELKRNAPPIYTGYYLAHKAHTRAVNRAIAGRTHKRLKNEKIRRYVRHRLKGGWSPELIAGRLKRLRPGLSISHESIYQWLYADARELIPLLVRAHKNRKRRGYSRRHKKTHIPERISIKERPKEVLQRQELGHWETDTAVSRQSLAALQVSVERKSRYSRIGKLDRKGAHEMSTSLTRRLSRYPQSFRLSITYDNGSENTEHVRTNQVLGTKSYFCEPFHSWERGTVENTIGLIRRFFPKKTDFAKVSKNTISSVEHWLNQRPRKCLGFQTPAEVFISSGVALQG
jgi:transposase, IS30 family